IVPIFIGFRRYLETKNKVFELTNERLKMTEGIFSKVTETLELYRVKDIEVLQPFIYRIVGLENIKVNTSDLSAPVMLLDGISEPSRPATGGEASSNPPWIRPSRLMTPTSFRSRSIEPTESREIVAIWTPRCFKFTPDELKGVSRIGICIRRTNREWSRVVNAPVSTINLAF